MLQCQQPNEKWISKFYALMWLCNLVDKCVCVCMFTDIFFIACHLERQPSGSYWFSFVERGESGNFNCWINNPLDSLFIVTLWLTYNIFFFSLILFLHRCLQKHSQQVLGAFFFISSSYCTTLIILNARKGKNLFKWHASVCKCVSKRRTNVYVCVYVCVCIITWQRRFAIQFLE